MAHYFFNVVDGEFLVNEAKETLLKLRFKAEELAPSPEPALVAGFA